MRIKVVLLGIISICLCGCCQSRQIARNDSEYLAAMDSMKQVWQEYIAWNNSEVSGKYGIPRMKLKRELKEHPERAEEIQPVLDSLNHCFDSLFAISNARQTEIEESSKRINDKYESISTEGFKGAFHKRHLVYSRETLDSIYHAAPRTLRRSAAGKAIREYLYGPKVRPGDRIIPFKCFDVNGKTFDWNIIKGRKTIIVADGMSCWTHGVDDLAPVGYFNSLREEFGPDFVLIVFFYNQDIDGLREQVAHFGLENHIALADGREFSSPLQEIYDCYVTPSFVLINPDGTLDRMEPGGYLDFIDDFLKK